MNKLLLQLYYFPLLLIFITLNFPLKTLSQSVAVHTIFEVKGKVNVKKEQWKNYKPAAVGDHLTGNDELDIATNSSVRIYCSNTDKPTVKPGKHNISSICPTGNPVIRLPNSNNDTLRTDGKTEDYLATLPYIITPRESYILTNTPLLRWNAVPGATNYTVNIDGINWETETNKTEIIYSGETPLKQRRRYRITIETDNGKSSTSDAVVGFTILDEETRNIILEAKKTIGEQELSPEEKGLILAQLYRGYELYTDAIEVLEELVKQESQIVAVYQLLGDSYLTTGLPHFAKKPYEKALELAIGKENLSVKANTQKGLGESYYSLGNTDGAVQWLEKAKTSYEELGDSPQVQELDETINRILGTQ
ncbi:MAG: tetratricopeptide repeat protein [Crocosphaera sp.]|nr:tetratricopeptide repeat protein [Crocosphaera sp.]